MQERTIIFLGPQGSGKGTQADLLADKLQGPVVRFEAGAMLRAFANEGGYTSVLTQAAMTRGELLPLFLSTRAFSEHLVREMKEGVHLLLDGFPRSNDQLPVFDSAIRFYRRESPTVLHVSISDEEAIRRLASRGRSDDTPEGIRRRLAWTRKEEYQVLVWFRSQADYRFVEVQGERSIEEIHADIMAKLGLQ